MNAHRSVNPAIDVLAWRAGRACNAAEGLAASYSFPHFLDLERLPENWKWAARALLHAALSHYIETGGKAKALGWGGRQWHLARQPDNRLQVSATAGAAGIVSQPGSLPDPLLMQTAGTIEHWRVVLRFRIGDNDGASIDQMPDVRTFPLTIDTEAMDGEESCGYALGAVLATALLKLYRPWPDGAAKDLDPCGGYLADAVNYLQRLRGRVAEPIRTACLMQLGVVLEMATNAPERLQDLARRIDALGNDDLHRMAMAAVVHEPEPGIFDGLME